MRLGIFGGSFNPIHYGHLLLAETCREQCSLDQVWLVPAADPPHKPAGALAAPKHRLAMLELAIAGYEPLIVCDMELKRGGISYTVDTLSEIHLQRPDDELFFLMGGDSLADLSTWREPHRICQLATPVVVRRAGSPEPDFAALEPLMAAERLAYARASQVEMPVIQLSSTRIRQAVATGRSIRYQTPQAVARYIQTQSLYQQDP